MVNILFASKIELGYAQIAKTYAENYKTRDIKIYSAVINRNETISPAINKVIIETGNKLSPPQDLSEISHKSIDILVSIITEKEDSFSLFLPGYPTIVKWYIPNYLKRENKNTETLAPYRKIRDKISNLVTNLFDVNYLNGLTSATNKTHFILDSICEGIIAHDTKRRITYFNKAAEEITGYTKCEVLGKDCHEVFPGNFCGKKCAFCDGCPELDYAKYNTEIYTKSGSVKSIEMSVSGIKNPKKELLGILASFRDTTEELYMAKRLRKIESFSGIIGKDPKMLEIFDLIKSVADSKAPVLIYGPSGTGKELAAAAIHNESIRSKNRFITVNCGAIPENLLEAELFGYVKGAYTGAIRDKKGRFELADGGTIFLDEIGDITPAMQVKILRVLQEGTFERLGSEKTTKVNVRVISATNKDLNKEIKAGNFREDLFYRISVVPVNLPPLKERKGDIPLLANHLLKRVMESEERKDDVIITQKALNLLMDYNWPGNIRELQNWLQFALIKSGRSGKIKPEHFPIFRHGIDYLPSNRKIRKKKLTAESVEEALEATNGNKLKAAKYLGVGRATLYRFLEEKNN